MSMRHFIDRVSSQVVVGRGHRRSPGACAQPQETARGPAPPPGRRSRTARFDKPRDWGTALGPSGCALLMWRYDSEAMEWPENGDAMRDVLAALAEVPRRACGRA